VGERGQDPDRRGLASPVRAEQRVHAAALDPQVDPVEDLELVVGLFEAVRLDRQLVEHLIPPVLAAYTVHHEGVQATSESMHAILY
jgi:hypothetical protein